MAQLRRGHLGVTLSMVQVFSCEWSCLLSKFSLHSTEQWWFQQQHHSQRTENPTDRKFYRQKILQSISLQKWIILIGLPCLQRGTVVLCPGSLKSGTCPIPVSALRTYSIMLLDLSPPPNHILKTNTENSTRKRVFCLMHQQTCYLYKVLCT